jgi:4-hydroxybenzoate polyprenyltransferase
LAGAPIFGREALVPALGSMALYAGGVALNDAFDVEKDRRLHPERVLPSGALGAGAAKAAGFLLLALGVASGIPQGPTGVVAAGVLAAAILLYDLLPDGAGALGAAVLGLCRGLDLFRGALAAPEAARDVVVFAAIHAVLVVCITLVSLGEDRLGAQRAVRTGVSLLPFCYAGPAIAAFRREETLLAVLVLVLSAELALWVVRPARRAQADAGAVVPRAVFTLTLLGALYCLAMREWAGAALLLAAFVASRLAARALSQRGS